MKIHRSKNIAISTALIAAAIAGWAVVATAQMPPPGPPLTPISQVQEYNTSWEEYQALKKKANGGTKHTPLTIPDWSGVWERKIRGFIFAFDDTGGPLEGMRGYAKASAQLTPKYKADYERVLADLKVGREWDRLSYCLPTGFPRWLSEPWLREFITTPNQTWLSHEQINETRRIYTDGRDHVPEADAIPLWLGDSIGFWDKDTLIIHTNHVKAGYYQRGQPAYSFQTTTVERWRKIDANTIEAKVTVYDPPSLVKPWHAVFYYGRTSIPNARVIYNACEENNNVVRGKDGGSQMIFPGDPGYRDPSSFGIPEVAMDTLPQ